MQWPPVLQSKGKSQSPKWPLLISSTMRSVWDIASRLRGGVTRARPYWQTVSLSDKRAEARMDNKTSGRLYDLAIDHLRCGRKAEALTILDTLISSHPSMTILHFKKGSILYEMKQFDRAAASFDLALTITPGDPETCYSKGAALQAQGKLEEALRNYDQALALQPNHPFALN